MNPFKNRWAQRVIFVLTSSLAVLGAERRPGNVPSPPASAAALFGDKVIAKGQGLEIRQSQVDEMFITFKANQAATGKRVPESVRPKIEADILEKIIATQLFLRLATEADKAKGKEIAALFVGEQIKQLPSEESFNRQLRSLGMSPEQYRAQILEQAIVNAVIDRELKEKTTVSETQMKEFYEKNPALFQDPELVRVRHVLVSTRDPSTGQDLTAEKKAEKQRLAQKVLARAKAGEDFVWLAKEFSDDAASKNKGGEYVIARSRDDSTRAVAPEFEGAAFSLGLNQVSEIVTTRYGYHVIKLIEKIPAQKIEYSKVEAKIKETLLREEVQKQLPDFVAKLKKEAGVEIFLAEDKK